MEKKSKTGKWILLITFLALTSVLTFQPAATAKGVADLVIMNAKVITVDKQFSIQQAIAVTDGIIVSVGSNDHIAKFIGPGTTVLDLKGKVILPGFNDAHAHPTEVWLLGPPNTLALGDPSIKSIADIQAAVAARVTQVQPGDWIHGDGWDPSQITILRHSRRYYDCWPLKGA